MHNLNYRIKKLEEFYNRLPDIIIPENLDSLSGEELDSVYNQLLVRKRVPDINGLSVEELNNLYNKIKLENERKY
jgi:hypothetical protein